MYNQGYRTSWSASSFTFSDHPSNCQTVATIHTHQQQYTPVTTIWHTFTPVSPKHLHLVELRRRFCFSFYVLNTQTIVDVTALLKLDIQTE